MPKNATTRPRGTRDNFSHNLPSLPRKIGGGMMLYAFMPLAIIYMEVLLRLLTDGDLLEGFPFPLFSALTAGLLFSILAALVGKPVLIRILASVLLFLLGLVFSLQYFMYQSYKVFMALETIALEAGNLMTGFTDIFYSTIISGIPKLLAFLAPAILYPVITMRRIFPLAKITLRQRARSVLAVCLIFVLSVGGQALSLMRSDGNMDAFSEHYNFDTTSRRLGLVPGISLDLWYSAFGKPYESARFASVELPDLSVFQGLDENAAEPTPTPRPPGADDDGSETDIDVEPIEYGFNMLDIDFESLIENERNAQVRAVHEYVASLPPSRQNPYTGLFEGKNLILITAEAFTKQVIDPVMTPTLYRLAHNGIYFSDFYQPLWGAGTAGGEFSIIAGLPPLRSSGSTLVAAQNNISYTIGNRLRGLGYFSASYHNGDYTYYNRHLTHTEIGYETFQAFGNGMNGFLTPTWPASDLEMMEFSLPQYIDNQPFSVYYMTISGHSKYSKYANANAAKNWDAFPEQYSQMPDVIRAYMAANLELEHALAYIVSELEKAGLADDTVIVMASDHYPYGLDRSNTWDSEEDYLNILLGVEQRTFLDRDLNAMILWSGCLENEHEDLAVEISSPTHTLDILPTLLNLFGLEFDSRMFVGRDVFSDAMPLALWSSDRSWKTSLGYFNNGRFTPVPEDAQIPDGYVDAVRALVNNKVSYAGSVLSLDYFNYFYYPDGAIRDGVLKK